MGQSKRNSVHHQNERHRHPISGVSVLLPEEGAHIASRRLRESNGATFMPEARPIEYMSWDLDNSKQYWATVVREMLAIVHGCERVRQYMC
ncbi:hypothetical protein LSAT2_003901 [Lamellibrachia satsuma]|nr:hypothetical protein LSAT2_003901 [Lamellibrachia satsuma]